MNASHSVFHSELRQRGKVAKAILNADGRTSASFVEAAAIDAGSRAAAVRIGHILIKAHERKTSPETLLRRRPNKRKQYNSLLDDQTDFHRPRVGQDSSCFMEMKRMRRYISPCEGQIASSLYLSAKHDPVETQEL